MLYTRIPAGLILLGFLLHHKEELIKTHPLPAWNEGYFVIPPSANRVMPVT